MGKCGYIAGQPHIYPLQIKELAQLSTTFTIFDTNSFDCIHAANTANRSYTASIAYYYYCSRTLAMLSQHYSDNYHIAVGARREKGWWRCPTFLGRFLTIAAGEGCVDPPKCPPRRGGIAGHGHCPLRGRKVVFAVPIVSPSLYPMCSHC